MKALCSRARLSRIYETRPLYVEDQPNYLNAVGEAFTSIVPAQMLIELQRIETALGRDRTNEVRRGARTLDLDILLCGQHLVQTPSLVVPHPFMTERLFVLVPLLELEPELADPRTGRPYREARETLEKEAPGGGGVYLHPAAGYSG